MPLNSLPFFKKIQIKDFLTLAELLKAYCSYLQEMKRVITLWSYQGQCMGPQGSFESLGPVTKEG